MKFYYLDDEPYFKNSHSHFANNIWHDGECVSYPQWLLSELSVVRHNIAGSFTSPEYQWIFSSESDRTMFALMWS